MSSQVGDAHVVEDEAVDGPAARRRRPLRAAALVGAVAALFALYVNEARTKALDSDGASQVLQAWDILHGNVLLKGWRIADVSFYTVDIPEYVLVEIVTGLRPDVVYIGAALTYTTLVVLAAWLAKGRATGREAWIRVGVAAGIMVAPSLVDGTRVFLSAPDHVGTDVPLLLAWIAVDRMRDTWRLPVVVGLLLTWDQIADPLTAVVGAVPVIVVAAVRCYQRRSSWRVDAGLIAAAVGSILLGTLIVRLIRAAGGYTAEPTGTVFAVVTSLSGSVWQTVDSLLILFGANVSGMAPGLDAELRLLHLVGLALAVWAFAVAARRVLSTRERVVPILVVGIVANLAAYTLTNQAAKPQSAREIVAVLPFAAVLAGRVLVSRINAARLVPALCVVAAGYLVSLGYWATRPPQPAPVATLVDWLETNHLTSGFGTYWAASATTVESGGTIHVGVIDGDASCDAYRPRPWNAKRSWYDPATGGADFLVVENAGAGSVPTAVAQFGEPSKLAYVGRYTIMVWNHDILPALNPSTGGCISVFAR